MDTPLTSVLFLSGQVVVVTGAAWGIGRVQAQYAVRVGARVGLADVDEAGLRETQDMCGGTQTALAVTADVRSEDDVRRLFDEARRTFGRLDDSRAPIADDPMLVMLEELVDVVGGASPRPDDITRQRRAVVLMDAVRAAVVAQAFGM